MRKKAAVQSAKVKDPEVAIPVVEDNQPAIAQTAAPETEKPVAVAEVANAGTKVATKAAATKGARTQATEQPAPAPEAPTKTANKAPAAAKEKAGTAAKTEKTSKVKKAKLVRDSFTIPESDYALFATIKERVLSAGIEAKKSEILRAAVAVLAKLDDAELIKAIGMVERIKTGRPKK